MNRKDPKDHKKSKERGLARRTLVATRTPPKLRSNSSLPATCCSWMKLLNSVTHTSMLHFSIVFMTQHHVPGKRTICIVDQASAPALAAGIPPLPWHLPWPSSCPSEPWGKRPLCSCSIIHHHHCNQRNLLAHINLT